MVSKICYNTLEVREDTKGSVDRFKDTLWNVDADNCQVHFSLHQAVHRPLGANWREWNLEHWGCKRDVSECVVSEYPDHVMIKFTTIRTSPKAWMSAVAKEFGVKLICNYEEYDVCGTITVTKDSYEDYGTHQNPIPREDWE